MIKLSVLPETSSEFKYNFSFVALWTNWNEFYFFSPCQTAQIACNRLSTRETKTQIRVIAERFSTGNAIYHGVRNRAECSFLHVLPASKNLTLCQFEKFRCPWQQVLSKVIIQTKIRFLWTQLSGNLPCFRTVVTICKRPAITLPLSKLVSATGLRVLKVVTPL